MEVTIEITDYCPNNCAYCSTNAGPNCTNVLEVAEVVRFLDDVCGKYYVNRINISGGEPLSHPYFYDILNICKSLTDNVWVYTNAITQVMYNTDIVKEIKVEANVCLAPGKSSYIPKNADKVHLLQLVAQGRAKNMKPANLKASGNIVRNECGSCAECHHVLLQADRKIVAAPCKKDY
jgi:organic radical activating enzyme